ncbi:xanthine dehydrogenase molybdopterin binding subunit [Granulosicoccus antarcticus]|uniref:Putative xanthine dehydrogenase subunit D n=1 Tax=Granulosicoccus antarcticus IMCC3135 TaxID=1192854 RepID=A0A2Z2NIE4_9GAMM|nr:xanthine dehydrogenase molybdopterin binding subunit [Granulosicoccus antarcticus]ASJ71106.1 putative xanthine dehydrogenase subunit D [Granulosicoccus antarcticus IMCC3135]
MSPQSPSAAGLSTPHESAHLHVSGEATYIDDIPEVAGTVHAALGTSERAHARILSMDLQAVRDSAGVIAVLTAADIPGENDCGPIIHDDPVLADGLVQFIGQPVFAVFAETYEQARRAARKATIDYEELPAILTAEEAHRQQSYVVPPMRLARGNAQATITDAPHSLRGKMDVGGQEHFYLEGQISYVLPTEDNGFRVHCSTQHPTEMQTLLCKLLKLRSHQVVVEMRRMGGGFGGKESQSALFCCVAALGASKLKRPVKLRLDRDDDMMISGKRHGFHYDYAVGYDDNGRILAASIELISQAGFSADLSQPVATRAVCHFDNAYYLDEVDIQAFCGKTNTQSNTAFRGFGGPQGAIAIEYIIDNIARDLGKEPLDVRKANFYGTQDRNTTPYGQVVVDNVIHELVDELETSSEYASRRKACQAFNTTSPVLKKGLALTPLKFGISFNVVHFNQAGALVHVYTDGSVLVNHGGTEMGQGLNTKVAQVVAGELGISISNVRSTAVDTSKVANTSATAASTGTDLNGKAAEDAARKIRTRLADFIVSVHGGQSDEVVFANDCVRINDTEIPFTQLVLEAYLNRVQLWSDGFYATPDLHWDKDTMTGRPFYYFAYGASVSEVLVDTLTGEWKLLRADLLHDVGNPINPAIDIGQIEGAFIQGMGWLTSEELRWNDKGKLTTHAPSTYKIPASNDCPDHFTTRLFDNKNVEKTVLRSKAVGEPPLLLPFSVFFAIRDAIASLADYRVNPPLNAPATPEAILDAIEATQVQARENGMSPTGSA